MAGDYTVVRGYTISGITGGYPVCTKLELLNGYNPKVVDTQVISDNNPNITVSSDIGYNSSQWGIRLYDADGNIIAERLDIIL